MTHLQYTMLVKPAVACAAWHITFGNRCLNCGWEERKQPMTLQDAMKVVEAKIPASIDETVKVRLHRAYDIVRQNGSGYVLTKSNSTVNPLPGGYVWHVHKASTAPAFSSDSLEAFYTVDAEGCSCPDVSRARAGLCKHRIATMLMVEMEKEV